MNRQIYINLPVTDLQKSTEFYKGLGFTQNSDFSDENASCVVWSDEIMVMLLTHDFYKQFIPGKTIADTKSQSAALLCISMDSKEAVDAFVQKAKELGGKAFDVEMNKEEDWMYGQSVEDPDGHIWEPLWTDDTKMQQA